jgi:glucokinase
MLLGFDIGGTHVRVALARGKQIVAMKRFHWPPALTPAEEVEFVAAAALELASKHGSRNQVSAAGVSMAAMLDRDGRVVQWPNRPLWKGLFFRELIESALKMPAAIEDDANAAALAELIYGAGQGCDHLLVIMAGTGVGAGLILNKSLFRGRNGWAGELGHISLLPDGPACACGKRGCLQSLASGRRLERLTIERGLKTVAELKAAAENRELWAIEALSECGSWVGRGAAIVADLLDLDAVVIGGGLSQLGEIWWKSLRETFQANLLNSTHRNVRLCPAELPDQSGILGAITLAERLAASRQVQSDDRP